MNRPVPNEDPGNYQGPPDDMDNVHQLPVLAEMNFRTLAQVAEEVRNAPAPEWLIQTLWPADAYGILGAEDKAGKTWAILDMALAVAAGHKWLDTWEVEQSGPVLVFVGEGSERKMVRRLYAIGQHYGLTESQVDALPIRLSMRVPNLSSVLHLAEVQRELAEHPARLVILDPLYLAAGDTETSQLNKMGVILGTIQLAAQAVGAALIVCHHWNQSGDGTGRKRFSGAGTAEWGRVLVSMSIIRRTTEDDEGQARSVVDLKLEVIGDEVPDTEWTIRRTVWAEDPTDLGSPMHYVVARTHLDPATRGGQQYDGAKAAAEALRHFFTTHPDEVLSTRRLYDRLRETGKQHDDKSVRLGAADLVAENFLTVTNGPRNSRIYAIAEVQS
ncbi:hypothetical protein BH10ACT1_BH10ACT1_19880 [soil metagenome]